MKQKAKPKKQVGLFEYDGAVGWKKERKRKPTKKRWMKERKKESGCR